MVASDNNPHECPFCGAGLSSGDKICKKCGRKIINGTDNGTKRGLGRALSEKYRKRIAEAEKKKELVTPEAKKTALNLFSLMPNIGKTRAEAFWNAGFRNLKDLKEASVDDIASVKGIGLKLAEKIHEDLSTIEEKVLVRGDIFLCSDCGALLSSKATVCGQCGAKVEEEEEAEEEEIEEVKKVTEKALYLCPRCGIFVGPTAEFCPECGFKFEEFEEEVKEKAREEIEAPEERPELYLCPECGAFLSIEANECSSCSAVFEMEPEAEEVEEEKTVLEKVPEPKIEEERPKLYLCPECGAFLSADANECGSCGAVFEAEPEIEAEEEVEIVPEKVPELIIEEEKPELHICPECGAFLSAEAMECESCGAVFEIEPGIEIEEEEEITLEKVPELMIEEEETELHICPECGAFMSLEAMECESCGTVFEMEPEIEAEEEEKPVPEKAPDFWYKEESPVLFLCPKCGAFIKEGLTHCSICGIDLEAELPVTEEEIHRIGIKVGEEFEEEIRDLEETLEELKPREEIRRKEIPTGEELEEEIEGLEVSLEEIEPEEEIRRKEIPVEDEIEEFISSLEAPRKRFRPKISEGVINGLTNGLTNGIRMRRKEPLGVTNGLTNGMVNGLTNGIRMRRKIQMGITNGVTNGLTNGLRILKGGLVNGITNGNGMTNGMDVSRNVLKGTKSSARVIMLILFVLLLLISPVFINVLIPSHKPMAIDGSFSDWRKIPGYSDSLTDQIFNEDINIEEYKVSVNEWGDVSFYLKVNGTILNGTHGLDSVHIFIDDDDNTSTGYRIGALGADKMIRVIGWNNDIHTNKYSEFNASRSPLDMNGFDRPFDLPVAVDKNEMETKLWLSALSSEQERPVKVLFCARDTAGNEDFSDVVISPIEGSLIINETSIASEIIPKGSLDVTMMMLEISALGDDITITSMNLTHTGTSEDEDVDNVRIFLDENEDGIFNFDDDEEIGRIGGGFVDNRLNIPLNLMISEDTTETIFITLDISEDARNTSTIGLRIERPEDVIFDPGVLTLIPLNLTNSYIGTTGDNITIDGAFGDWDRDIFEGDTYQDVKLGNDNAENANIDILSYDIQHDSDSLSFYMDVSGTMLGGVTVPWNASRPPEILPSEIVDSDGDGIPDEDEPGFEQDFDNDGGQPDNLTNPVRPNTGPDDFDHDSDNDGIEDWPWGNDTMLVQPVTKRRKYIGPTPPIPELPVITGEDVTYIFIDADDDTSTGFHLNDYIGADFMLNISGKGNLITSKRINRFNSPDIMYWKWDFLGYVNVAVDSKALETQVDFNQLGIPSNQSFKVWFFTTDWRDGWDLSDDGITETRGGRGTRAPGGGKVVLNEIFPDTNGWVELYNKGKQSVDISGWVISWDGSSYTIPAGTTIASGNFLAFDVGSIPSSGTVTLYNDKGQQKDTTTYASVPSGQGWGRYPDGEDNWVYTNPTKEAPNEPYTPPPPSNVVINEVYPDANGWVELYNKGDKIEDIGGWYIVWSGGTYTIPPNTKIQKYSFLAFDVGSIPATDTVRLYDDADVEQDNASFSSIPLNFGWGRYPDGTSSWWVTYPTKEGPNMIPEFPDAIAPLMFTFFIFSLVRYKKNKKWKKEKMDEDGEENG